MAIMRVERAQDRLRLGLKGHIGQACRPGGNGTRCPTRRSTQGRARRAFEPTHRLIEHDMFRPNARFLTRQKDRAADHIFQLAHIARPGVRLEQRERLPVPDPALDLS